MIDSITILIIIAGSFLAGALTLYAIMVKRIWDNSPHNDDSNATNPVRALNHFVLHPIDYRKMFYLPDHYLIRITEALPDLVLHRPLWYMDKDEYSEVVKTRPSF